MHLKERRGERRLRMNSKAPYELSPHIKKETSSNPYAALYARKPLGEKAARTSTYDA